MNCKLLGVTYVDYVSKRTNKPVKGCIIYIGQPIEKNGSGISCEKFFISSNVSAYDTVKDILSIGSEIELYFNQYGNITTILEA